MSKKITWIILIILLVVSIIVCITIRKSQSMVMMKQTDTSSWKEYSDLQYNFSFKYPPNLVVNTKEAPGQWQVSLIKTDSLPEGSYNVINFFVETYTASLEDMYGHNPEFVQEKTVPIVLNGDKAVRISFCEIAMPYDPPCILPETEKEVSEKAKKVIISHNNVIYTLTLPWYNDDTVLLGNILSTLKFKS